MTALTTQQIRDLLARYSDRPLRDEIFPKIKAYLEVFELWSGRVNLTTVRDPAQVVQRHFGEGLTLAQALPDVTDLLDLGSGAGFPGIPIALAKPETMVTLAEVQSKKSAFLKEVVARMELRVEVWARRAEDLAGKRQFDAVTLRAVDNMPAALSTAVSLLRPGGTIAYFVGKHDEQKLPIAHRSHTRVVAVPGSPGYIILARLE